MFSIFAYLERIQLDYIDQIVMILGMRDHALKCILQLDGMFK